ncbi:MAG TPA: ferredoxin reductase family protein, partial [Acidothermaceae bacterium]
AAAARRTVGLTVLWLALLANASVIVWLWYHGGNVTGVHSQGQLLTSIARITGLLGAYLALVQVILLARVRPLERLVGFDRLTVWHRWNGYATLWLILAHVFFSIWGYADMDRLSFVNEIPTMIWQGHYPGMIVATVGTFLFVVVVASSVVIVRRRLDYRYWYAVHFTVYAAIALGWFHQIPTGNELVVDTAAADYWRSLYLATLALLLAFRLVIPAANALRYRLRVAEVVPEGPGVVSLRITGRDLDHLKARGGQFFLWRFLTRRDWFDSHPFSLSALPEDGSLRITVKSLGDFTSRAGDLAPGTRVMAEGPFGVFTTATRRRDKVALIAGGIGITAVRALLQEADGDVVVLYRALTDQDLVLRREVDALARPSGITVHYIVGDHATPDGERLLAPEHLTELVPDIREREIYVCGPPGMTDVTAKNVRAAGVPRRHIHIERFAL